MAGMTPREFINQLDLSIEGVTMNGKSFTNLQDMKDYLHGFEGIVNIGLETKAGKPVEKNFTSIEKTPGNAVALEDDTLYQIMVKRYMTKASTPTFVFMKQWNNDIPMPLRVMVGRKIQETKGMVKMELWGQMVEEIETVCMKCGRTLTNKVSQYFGIGPECGGHNYVNPFNSDAELKAAVEENNKKLLDMKWTGWIIKSAIEVWKEL